MERGELNCPNCGAPLSYGCHCEYCGTNVMDFTIDKDKPFFIKIKIPGGVFIDRVRLMDLEKRVDCGNDVSLYYDNAKYITFRSPETTYKIELLSLGVDT